MKQVYPFLYECWHRYLYGATERNINFISPLAGEKNFGWYVWLGRPGVYELQIQEWYEKENYEKSIFNLRFYPHPDDDLYETYDFFEQLVRASDLFDDSLIVNDHGDTCTCAHINRVSQKDKPSMTKGIPKIGARKMLGPAMFQVGKISITMQDGRLNSITGESQDLLVTIAAAGLVLDVEGQKKQILAPGEVDRRVLGWELTWDFLSVFTAEVVGQMGVSPIKEQRDCSPGVICYYGEGGEVWTEESKQLNAIKFTLIYREGC